MFTNKKPMTVITPYLRPTALEQALEALADGSMRIAAGCTDLFPATDHKHLQGPILDITGIGSLRGIINADEGIRIGATTTWMDLIKADLPPACRGLQLAAQEVGALQIHNRGTIAGNLCNASPAADGIPPLLTLDVKVELQSKGGTRVVPLQNFITGPRKTVLAENELVTSLLIPKSSLTGQSHFLKLGARVYLVISIAMTSARIVVRNGIVVEAALAIGSCGPVATRLPKVEAQMIGKAVDPKVINDDMVAAAIDPISDIRATAAYRAISAAELLRRTVMELAMDQEAVI